MSSTFTAPAEEKVIVCKHGIHTKKKKEEEKTTREKGKGRHLYANKRRRMEQSGRPWITHETNFFFLSLSLCLHIDLQEMEREREKIFWVNPMKWSNWEVDLLGWRGHLPDRWPSWGTGVGGRGPPIAIVWVCSLGDYMGRGVSDRSILQNVMIAKECLRGPLWWSAVNH